MRRGSSRLWSAATVALALLAGLVPAGTAGANTPTFHEVSPLPLTSVTSAGSAVGTSPDGQPWLYFVSSGQPAYFSIVDARTGERVEAYEMPGAGGAWAVDTAPDGDVYVGSYSTGALYRYDVSERELLNLGVQVPGQTAIWSIAHDEEGNVYGGTGQSAHVFQYDPGTGRTRDYGSLAPNDDPLLARSITAGEGSIYVGVGAVPGLYQIDIMTGETTEIPLPDEVLDMKYVYDLDLRGSLLFVRGTTDGGPSALHVYDTVIDAWVQRIEGAHGLFVTPVADDGRTVYFVKDSSLYSYDLVSRTLKPTALTGVTNVRGFGFLDLGDPAFPGDSVVGLYTDGRYFVYNPETGQYRHARADAVGAPAPLRAMSEGPDGKVYFGSFLAGGLASYDPETGEKELVSEALGQAEGMTQHDGAVYVGTYPSGTIWRHDPANPGAAPAAIVHLEEYGQSRPFAMTSAGEYLAVGTVAANGTPGGGLTLLDTDTGEVYFEDVIPGHSVVALAHHEGILYGATSVFGGAGAPRPTEADAVLFAYDVDERELLWQIAPAPGEGALGEIAFDKAGTLWTHTPMTVLNVDVHTQEVISGRNYGPYPWDQIDHAWTAARLWVDPYDDDIYAVTQGAMYRIDPETLERGRYFRPASYGFMHNNGNVFLSRDPSAWEYTPNSRTAAVMTVSPAASRGEDVTLTIEGLGAGEPVEIFDRSSDRSWGTRFADDDGRVTMTMTVPSGASDGQVRVETVRIMTRGVLGATYEIVPRECTTTLSGRQSGGVHVTSGTTCLYDAEVNGRVTVAPGAALVVSDSVLRGELSAQGPSVIGLTGSRVNGGVAVEGATSAVWLDGTTVRGAVTLTDGSGPAASLTGNVVSGSVSCAGNAQTPAGEGPVNEVSGGATGQCAWMNGD